LTINPIEANGHVVEKTTHIVPDRPKSHCILVDAANKYCYATSLGADIIMQWKFDPTTGTLTPIVFRCLRLDADAAAPLRRLDLHLI